MKEKTGEVFSITEENKPVAGCTISKEVYGGDNYILYFSLAKDTDISAEIFPYHKLLIVAGGEMEVYSSDGEIKKISKGESILTRTGIPVGMRSGTSVVYTEIEVRKEDKMNDVIKAGNVFKLADLVPYQEGKIVNMDVVHNKT